MADNFLGKLAVVTAGAALSLAVMGAQPAGAATITYDFTLHLTSGAGSLQSAVGNEYSGFFSYDDSQIYYSDPRYYGSGAYQTYPTDFSLNFNNTNYTRADLVTYSRGRGGTVLQFTPSDNTFNLTNFWRAARTPGSSYSSFNLSIPSAFGGFLYNDTDGFGSGSATFSLRETPTSRVPEPGTAFGLGVLGAGWLRREKRASRSSQSAAGNWPKRCASAPARNRQQEGTAP